MFLWPSDREERLSLSTAMEVPKEAKSLSRTDMEGVTSTVMEAPHFTGEDTKGRRWSVKAKEAVQKFSETSETMVLNELEGESTLKDGQEVKFKAGSGQFQNETGDMALKGNVHLQGLGYTLKTQEIIGNIKTLQIRSQNKIFVTSTKGLLEAGAFYMQAGGDKMTFLKGVSVRLVSLNKNSSNAEPLDIEAQKLENDQSSSKAVFTGNVKVTKGDATLGAQVLNVTYAQTGQDRDIQKVQALNDVIITSGGNTATGDKAIYTPESGKILLTGDVVMTKGDNIIKGENLTYDLDTGDMRVHNTESNQGDGRIKAKFKIKGKD